MNLELKWKDAPEGTEKQALVLSVNYQPEVMAAQLSASVNAFSHEVPDDAVVRWKILTFEKNSTFPRVHAWGTVTATPPAPEPPPKPAEPPAEPQPVTGAP